MNYIELMDLILNSSRDSWLFDDSKGHYTLKSNLNVSIRRQEERQVFDEPWVKKVPSQVAESVFYDVYYGAVFVETHFLVSVDGDRAHVPLPDPTTLVVSEKNYLFARAINVSDQARLDYYFELLGLNVRKG